MAVHLSMGRDRARSCLWFSTCGRESKVRIFLAADAVRGMIR